MCWRRLLLHMRMPLPKNLRGHRREYLHAVRRHRPSDLLPALAGYSAAAVKKADSQAADELDLASWPKGFGYPWTISAIARDSILYGTENRSARVTNRALHEIMNRFNVTDSGRKADGVALMLTSVAYEQFPYQESEWEEMARIYALFDDPALGPQFDWVGIFGMSLAEAVRGAFVLRVWVANRDGRFDPSIADLSDMQEIFDRVAPRDQVEAVAALLTTTVEEARRAHAAAPEVPSSLARYDFNPLSARPLVDLGEQGIWAPQVMLVDRALHPLNLYYRGWDAWGKSFADDLGIRTEAYVGRQLSLVADADSLHKEIVYKEGKDEKKSIDWFWVTDQAVILFECKSARLTLEARAGGTKVSDIADRTLNKARKQLDETERRIQSRIPPFDQFPNDRPIVGVVVTAEPFYLANSTFTEYGVGSRIPSLTMSLRELETWVCVPAEVAVDSLLKVLGDPERRSWPFDMALREILDDAVEPSRNPILDEAWKQYDFLDSQLFEPETLDSSE